MSSKRLVEATVFFGQRQHTVYVTFQATKRPKLPEFSLCYQFPF